MIVNKTHFLHNLLYVLITDKFIIFGDALLKYTLKIHARSCFKRHPYETWALEHKCIRWVESYETSFAFQ